MEIALILKAATMIVAASKEASAIVSQMQQEGRSTLTPEEEDRLNAESESIHSAHAAAIAKARAEGR